MKPFHLTFLLVAIMSMPAAAQKSKGTSSQENWVITGKGPTEFLTATRRATFRDKVHLSALPEMEMDCELAIATMGEGGGQKFELIEAEKNVVIKIYEVKDGQRKTRVATADKAVYRISTDTVTLTGNAKFEDEMGTFSAEIIHYNRTTGDMRSEGPYRLEGKPRAQEKK